MGLVMIKTRTVAAKGEMLKRFVDDRRGATLAYVAISLTAMMGVVALSYDLGRHYILSTELQKAADAAATAGAYQLDPSVPAATVAQRVADAVDGSAITANSNRVGKPGDTGAITIASHQILKSIPADDDTAIGSGNVGPPYNYVSVTTSAKASNNVFGRVIGQPAEVSMTATAVARKGQAICNVTPLMMCSPDEANFNPDDWIGRQLLLKAGSGSGPGSWAPGNWGLVDAPNGSQSTTALGEMIGGISGLPVCLDSSGIDTKPGNVASIRTAFNVRFDMYENPHFGGNGANAPRNSPNFPPAENVTKGLVGKNGGGCSKYEPPNNPVHRLPRDSGLDPDCSDASCRFGSGDWDCASYWLLAHGGTPPTGCSNPATMTRYELYRYEIENGIPNTRSGNNGENGNPTCYGGTVPPTPTDINDRINDRRILTVAVVNCGEYGVKGNSQDVPVEHYISVFMTEAVADTSDNDLYVEIVGHSQAGGGGLVPVIEREWVEVVR